MHAAMNDSEGTPACRRVHMCACALHKATVKHDQMLTAIGVGLVCSAGLCTLLRIGFGVADAPCHSEAVVVCAFLDVDDQILSLAAASIPLLPPLGCW